MQFDCHAHFLRSSSREGRHWDEVETDPAVFYCAATLCISSLKKAVLILKWLRCLWPDLKNVSPVCRTESVLIKHWPKQQNVTVITVYIAVMMCIKCRHPVWFNSDTDSFCKCVETVNNSIFHVRVSVPSFPHWVAFNWLWHLVVFCII